MQVSEFPANSTNKVMQRVSFACSALALHITAWNLTSDMYWLTCGPFRLYFISAWKLEKGETIISGETIAGIIIAKLKKKTWNLIVPIPLGTNIGLSYKRPTVSQQWFIAEFQSFSIHYSFQIVFKLSVEEKRPLGDAEMKIIFKYSCTRYLIIESVH